MRRGLSSQPTGPWREASAAVRPPSWPGRSAHLLGSPGSVSLRTFVRVRKVGTAPLQALLCCGCKVDRVGFVAQALSLCEQRINLRTVVASARRTVRSELHARVSHS